MFYVTTSGNLERFQYFSKKSFQINWSTIFQLKALRSKMHHFHRKLPHQKPMLRQIEWWVQNRSIAKNAVLPETSSFFWRFFFSLRTSYKVLIWCTNNPNGQIRTFYKRWSFIWRCFFHVSILKLARNIFIDKDLLQVIIFLVKTFF